MKTKRITINVAEAPTGFRARFSLSTVFRMENRRGLPVGSGATPQEAVADLVAKGWDLVKYDRYNPGRKS